MENNFSQNSKNLTEEGYVFFEFWQLIIIGLSLAIIIVNSFISGGSFIIWLVNFLLQLAVFTVVASLLALLFKAVFKRSWAAAFSVVLMLGALFGLYDSIRGYNFRQDAEKAYKEQMEQAQQQAALEQSAGQQSNQPAADLK